MPRFVLEIGTEEIPPRYFPVALPSLAEQGRVMLERARLSFRETKVYGTPRRLVLIAEELAAVQAPAVREERGPAAKVAFDADGKPTKAAEGFARRWGLTPDKLERRQTQQGEYVFAIIQEPELPAAPALAPLLPSLITGIPFPKTMRWGTGKLRFGRPIRWLLALVDEQVVEFELDGIRSGRLTRGHPVLAEGMHEVGCAADYEQTLERHYVIVNPDRRCKRMLAQVEMIRKPKNARVVGAGLGMWPWEMYPLADLVADPELFAQQVASDLAWQTTLSVEWPTPGLGHFEETFLVGDTPLPGEVLIEEMQHVQSYFPLEDDAGQLLPSFVAVRDGGDQELGEVVRGWESVLRAKLIDASYFYEQDLTTSLADRVESLKGIIFQERLGTVYEKVERVRATARSIADQLHLPPGLRADLDRAAYLCKADLSTAVTMELPSLQGVMGGHYARMSGEPQRVWEGIAEHYHPRFAGDQLPGGGPAVLLALCDKLDTIVACFAAGVVPTGSADPMGLRRESAGAVRILCEAGIAHPVLLAPLIGTALCVLYEQVALQRPKGEVAQEVVGFLAQRLAGQLRDEGIRYDVVDAALAVGVDDLNQASKRAQALRLLATRDEFLPTVVATTRVINITKDFDGGEVDPSLFQEEAERALWDAHQEALKKAESASLIELFGVFAGMRGVIDRFFDEVLVMHEDEKIRRNRLALCWHINHDLFRRLADFSLIVQT